jgi:hypothetical protein
VADLLMDNLLRKIKEVYLSLGEEAVKTERGKDV